MIDQALLGLAEFKTAKEYWLTKLSGEIQGVRLPYVTVEQFQPATPACYESAIPATVAKRLLQIGKGQDLALYIVMFGAFLILLRRYTGQADLVVVAPTVADVSNEIGHDQFILLRGCLREATNFRELLNQLKQTVIEGYRNQHLSGATLLDLFKSEDRLTQVVFGLEPLHSEASTQILTETLQTDLTLMIRRFEDRLGVLVYFNRNRLDQSFIQRFMAAYVEVLQQISIDFTVTLDEIRVIPPNEQATIGDFCHSSLNYPPATLHGLFERQADKTPEATAIRFKDTVLSYRTLDERANQVARYLKTVGNGEPLGFIGVCSDHPVEQVIAILGILKAGGAYLPLDNGLPEERLKTVLEDAEPAIIIVNSQFEQRLQRVHGAASVQILNFELNCNACSVLAEFPTDRPGFAVKPDSNAYLIYTSGSTGLPKGVVVEHASISRTLQWRRDEYGFTGNDRVLQLFSYTFDGFITSFFTPVLAGASVMMLEPAEMKDPAAIAGVVLQEQITHFIAVPALYQSILEYLSPAAAASLRVVTLAGDRVTPRVINKSQAINPRCELVNEYGPTECAVAATVRRNLQDEAIITVGKPIANTSAYVVNPQFEIQPIGVPGELCLAGERLARGYHHRPQSTTEKFIDNPFQPGQRLYRTGDLARWLDNGDLEFLGRIDHQVKVRGFRIELGEIETVLLRHPLLTEAVVVPVPVADDETILSAFYVATQTIPEAMLRQYLSGILPEYMIPVRLEQVDLLPLSSNGKVDRQALQIQWKHRSAISTMAPRDTVEQTLAALWQEILHVDSIGIDDNFFELGGHSLKTITLTTRIQQTFNVEISINEIFQEQTLAKLAQRIRAKRNELSEMQRIIQDIKGMDEEMVLRLLETEDEQK